ncbi:nuclear transport factor 2 family protein [Mycobacterium lentiflavum]|jgi:hypothetical protein|uniref:Nuclear transport factor 2 family protein n=1 Tax=Mycobacterium lentiflavum TaxID=141349 RepID=A0ABY3UV85_MYCLN|nr:nuclear transport factor 2 family protein [Mycobacterium lentiflavum]ULP41609.1 nuclear transport factor 2 family protein [Mycobacterium lentiflavum]
MTESLVEQRLCRIEDTEAIKIVTARYADAINHGYDGKALDLAAISEVFTADARWSSDDFGTTVGAQAIAAELPAATARVTCAMHTFLNPIITVDADADTATARWQLWIASVYDGRPGTVHMGAEMTYVRTPAGWRIKTLHIGQGFRIPAGTSAPRH